MGSEKNKKRSLRGPRKTETLYPHDILDLTLIRRHGREIVGPELLGITILGSRTSKAAVTPDTRPTRKTKPNTMYIRKGAMLPSTLATVKIMPQQK